jgi:tetraacyldisaccharide 4'-kinase
MRAVDRIWWGRDAVARLARAALTPAEALYAGVVAARGALYDAGLLEVHPLALPSVSVGNLTVGGTGKTPVAAWLARALAARGAHPAIVLRGYGADEPLVHAAINPRVPVVVSADRVAGVEHAARRGADVAVLDDAFQHRRARRLVDIVLVSADRWTERPRLLPAGPWREPLGALRRASLVLVTRKAVSLECATELLERLRREAPSIAGAVAHLAPDALGRGGSGAGESLPVAALSGARLLAVSAIGDPDAFLGQLAAAGASVVDRAIYPDHHAFTSAEARELARRGAAVDRVVCTLKDAVKLGPLWPREAPPLWYVSQRVTLERGQAGLHRVLDLVLSARHHLPQDGWTPPASPT